MGAWNCFQSDVQTLQALGKCGFAGLSVAILHLSWTQQALSPSCLTCAWNLRPQVEIRMSLSEMSPPPPFPGGDQLLSHPPSLGAGSLCIRTEAVVAGRWRLRTASPGHGAHLCPDANAS